MHREGVHPDTMVMTDILCDFCHNAWTEDRPMVEGHRGACICLHCLTLAYMDLVHHGVSDEPKPGEICVMCREERAEAHWRSPLDPDKLICKRCCKQAAGVLHKDDDIAWWKPVKAVKPTV